MQFWEILKARRSVRGYRSDPVPEEKLQRVLEAVRLAPTAANMQPFKFIVIKNKEKREALKAAYSPEWFWTAPVIICACAKPKDAWKRSDGKNYAEVDTTIAMDHLILAATAEGLGTCWIGAFDVAKVREILGIPKELEPIAMTPLGYPADKPSQKIRKPLEELVEFIC